ncbi:MAG: chorismate mutase [Betaproteobacteria bacterium HGW-Betaproteobacteria-6]|nr:MAG: chorismate mutase [Betaproteobacteria bacterium HGW-Betaproteobacteria-6]
MTRIAQCASMAEVRHNIDRLDRQLVALIAERGAYVRQAAGFKKSAEEVPAPQRVAQVLAKVDALAVELGADPGVVDATWRAMIAAFIDAERLAQAALHPPSPQPH